MAKKPISNRPKCSACDVPMWHEGLAVSGKDRWKCPACKTRTTRPDDISKGYDEALAERNCSELKAKIRAGCKKFIITSLTNNSTKHGKGIESLLAYANSLKAPFLIIPNHYKNKDKFTKSNKLSKKFSAGLEQYFIDQNIYIGGGIEIRGDISIEAPAVHPLQGKGAIGGARTTIYGHPQLAMQPVGTPGGMLPKRMWATGSINRAEYSRSDRGAKAHFHHVIGALIVEVAGNNAFIRPLIIDSKGGFYDLDRRVDGDKITKGHKWLAMVTGDEHEIFMAKNVRKVTYGKGGLAEKFKPKYIVRHDIIDGYAGSHHHEKMPLVQFKKHHTGMNNYRTELDRVVKHLNESTPKGCQNLIVESNHHYHIDQWLSRVDANKDHVNALLICELQAMVRESVLSGGTGQALPLYVMPRVNVPTEFLSINAPRMIKEYDVAQHSHVGVNGSRGSAKGFTNTVYKKIVGHGHGACIDKGVIQAGTSTGRLEYEKGYGTHSNTHAGLYPNGKPFLIDIIGNRYHGQ